MNKILLLLLLFKQTYADELFEDDLSDAMKIGLSETGYKLVKLECTSDGMLINLETNEDFFGVIYTRGNFYDREDNCFLDADVNKKQRRFTLKLPFEKCNTKQEKGVYSNTVILQHDKELIFPGDVAFSLECDFDEYIHLHNVPITKYFGAVIRQIQTYIEYTCMYSIRHLGVETIVMFSRETSPISRIRLTNADPSEVIKDPTIIKSDNNTVIMTPVIHRKFKEEL